MIKILRDTKETHTFEHTDRIIIALPANDSNPNCYKYKAPPTDFHPVWFQVSNLNLSFKSGPKNTKRTTASNPDCGFKTSIHIWMSSFTFVLLIMC